MTDGPGPPGGQPGISELIAVRDAHDGKMTDLVAVGEAEGVVASARMAGLEAAWKAAVRRHRAAKGLVTRARKDGSAKKIADAVQREREASGEADRIMAECTAEIGLIIRGGLDRMTEFREEWHRTLDAQAAINEASTR